MSKVLVVIGSARKGRVADKVTELVAASLADKGHEVTIADLKEVNLPFFDNERSPSDPEYVATDENVLAWGGMVAAADNVLFVTPEYNHNLSAIQKNAIDSLFVEWNNKPITIVSYGWSGGSLALAAVRELAPVIRADLKEETAQLFFTKDLQLDGSVIEGGEAIVKINTALTAL